MYQLIESENMTHGLPTMARLNEEAAEQHRIRPFAGFTVSELQDFVHSFRVKAQQNAVEATAKGVNPTEQDVGLLLALLEEEFNELKDAVKADDFKEFIDALGDIIYVTLSGFCMTGTSAREVLHRVCVSNASKFREGYKISENGKLIKSPLYEEVGLTDLVPENGKLFST